MGVDNIDANLRRVFGDIPFENKPTALFYEQEVPFGDKNNHAVWITTDNHKIELRYGLIHKGFSRTPLASYDGVLTQYSSWLPENQQEKLAAALRYMWWMCFTLHQPQYLWVDLEDEEALKQRKEFNKQIYGTEWEEG